MTSHIVHVTSVHSRFDTRIFHKECLSAVKAGYKVTMVVADGLGDALVEGVCIVDVGRATGRLKRILLSSHSCMRRAKGLQPNLLHLHDPELLPHGWIAAVKGYTVVFDAHEDVAKQILGKSYLTPLLRRLLSMAYRLCESSVLRKLSALVAATPHIRDLLVRYNTNVVDINNFPRLGELAPTGVPTMRNPRYICYVGGLSRIRGVVEIVEALDLVKSDVRLLLAGKFQDEDLEQLVRSHPGWSRVDFLGFLGREGIRDILTRSDVGLVTLHPQENYLEALPVKMFEYMAAGLPVIASDFPVWREIVKNSDCGLCVDPLLPQQIADAIDALLTDANWARQLGQSGRNAVESRYNWGTEERKLLELYRTFCGDGTLRAIND